MRIIAIFLMVLLIFCPLAIAYPQEDLQECVLSTQSNPNLEGVDEGDIETFCDCALILLVDEGQKLEKAQASINECAINSFS